MRYVTLTDLPQLAMEPTRNSLVSLTTADDLGGTGIGLDASLVHTAADDDDGDDLCDTECSTHGEQRFIDNTLRVATLDCILVHTQTNTYTLASCLIYVRPSLEYVFFILWLHCVSNILPSVKFAEDKVLTFLILCEKC